MMPCSLVLTTSGVPLGVVLLLGLILSVYGSNLLPFLVVCIGLLILMIWGLGGVELVFM